MKLLNPFFSIIGLCLLLFFGMGHNRPYPQDGLWDRSQGTVEALFYDASLNSTSTVGPLPVAELINYLDITDERLEKGTVHFSPEVLALMEELHYFELASAHKSYQEWTVAGKRQQLSGKFKVTAFKLPDSMAMELQDDLFILSQDDVVIDGDVFGKAIEDGNRPGQNLVIKTEGKIIIRGNIYLSKGGDAPFSKPCLAISKNHSVFQVLLAGGMAVNSSLNLVKKQHEIEMPEALVISFAFLAGFRA